MNYADVLYALREEGQVENSFGGDESEAMDILRDDQGKLCAAIYTHYASGQRRIVNQM
jgi:hypothetical protein